MSPDLTGLFNPKSIAVIGASEKAQKIGAIALKNIIVSGYKGRVYPVNPKVTNIGDMEFYPDVKSLPEVPDLAVVAIPAAGVNQELKNIGEKGIKNVVIFSAGFREVGLDGEKLEMELVETAKKYELNVLGPNCLGFASPLNLLNISFGQVVKTSGNLRMISQSGAIAASLFDWSQSTGLGFNDFVTLGNKSVLGENEILKYWKKNQKSTPIGLYLESIDNGAEFVKTATEISREKPIFILKPGKSSAAAAAMRSHTGAIAGEDRVLEAALRQAGIIRCEELGEFFDMAQALAWENVPQGDGVAVVTNAGGPAVLSTDTITKYGLKLASLGEETKKKLGECLPRIASFINPIDVLGDALADRFGEAIEIVLDEKNTQSVLVILTPQLMTQIEKTATTIGVLSKKYSKPIFCSFIGGGSTYEGKKVLNRFQIPNFSFPERAIKTLAAMWQWQKWRSTEMESRSLITVPGLKDNNKIKEIILKAQSEKMVSLDNESAKEVMDNMNVPTPESMTVINDEDLKDFSLKNGWSVVLKLSGSGLLHKVDVGGVICNIKNDAELETAYKTLLEKREAIKKDFLKPVQIQIQKQVEAGVEVIIGAKRDSVFGPVLLFGAGGKYAEILADHNLHLLPLTMEDVKKLVENSKIYKLLSGYRDDKPYQLDQVYEIMLSLGQLFMETPEILEMEINPLIITHRGPWAVDTKVVIKGKT